MRAFLLVNDVPCRVCARWRAVLVISNGKQVPWCFVIAFYVVEHMSCRACVTSSAVPRLLSTAHIRDGPQIAR